MNSGHRPRPVEPSTGELVELGAPVVLRDGSPVRVRQGHRSDKDLLLRGFTRLSPESRYRRFLSSRNHLTEADVRSLTEIDHHDHEAIAAIDERTGEGIGIARYIRDPHRPETAEIAVTVIDDWQGKGLGTLLLETLAGRARTEGIQCFTALLLASNTEMRSVLATIGPMRTIDEEMGTIEIEVPIGAGKPSPALRKLLRVLARDAVASPLSVPPSRTGNASPSDGADESDHRNQGA